MKANDGALAVRPHGQLALKHMESRGPRDSTDSDTTSSSSSSRWNTKNLPSRIAADILSASSSAALIAPAISIIDRSIIENASGRSSIPSSIRSSLHSLLRHPLSLLLSRPSALIFLLYAGTYSTANIVDSISSTLTHRPATHVSSGPSKFAASSAANISLCVYKDQAFARAFGPLASSSSSSPPLSSPLSSPRPVTLPSYALFTLRDCLTIFASFNLPPLIAPLIDTYILKSNNSSILQDPQLQSQLHSHLSNNFHISGAVAAQFLAPTLLQLFSTPIHLLGLDIYNRPHAPLPDRIATIRANWLISSLARMGRVIPAFGIGGVCNTNLRYALMKRLE